MPDQAHPKEKVCRICGQDCSGRPRIKDPAGRYYCRACYDRAKQQRAAAAAKRASPPPRPVQAVPVPRADPPDLLADIAAAESAAPAIAGGSGTCESCGAPRLPGAVICAQCGYNRTTGRRVETAVLASTPAARRTAAGGGDIVGLLGQPWVLFALPTVFFAILFAVALSSEDAALMYVGVQGIFGLVIGILVLIRAFQESVGTGFLTLCVPFYVLYFVFSVNDNPQLKALFGASMLAGVASYYLQFTMSPVF